MDTSCGCDGFDGYAGELDGGKEQEFGLVWENVGYCFILAPPKDRWRRREIQFFSSGILKFPQGRGTFRVETLL